MPGLTVCPRDYRRRRAVDFRGPTGPGVVALQCGSRGHREGRRSYVRAEPCLHGGLHPASSSDRTRSPRGGPPPGAGAERKSRNLLSSESARFNSMVMVAEHDDAGMRRRARRDQNDREEKAETMRQESRNQPSIPGGGALSRRPPPPRAILADYIRAGFD